MTGPLAWLLAAALLISLLFNCGIILLKVRAGVVPAPILAAVVAVAGLGAFGTLLAILCIHAPVLVAG